MGDAIRRLGDLILDGLTWLGGLGRMLWIILRRGPRRPFGIYDISYQMVQLGIRSLPLATLMSVVIGMILAWQFGWALADFGAKMALGYTCAIALVREIIPFVLAVTVGVKMSAGMAAELGSMKVTEQIDAVAALGADPVKKLIWPRFVAATLGLPLLTAWGNIVGMLGGMLIGETVYGVPAEYFYQTYIEELVPLDYISSLVKAVVFGALVGTIGCMEGFGTKFGTEAVGKSTTAAVVSTAISVIIADFFLTMLFTPAV